MSGLSTRLSNEDMARQLAGLSQLYSDVFGALLITHDGFILQSSLPPAVHLDRLWDMVKPYIAGEVQRLDLDESMIMIEAGKDVSLVVVARADANATMIGFEMRRLMRALADSISAMLNM